jgi:hypothetical protein
MFNNYNNKYLIIQNEYVGKVIKELWDNTCALIKLENHTDYVDVTIKQNNILKKLEESIADDNEGYLIATSDIKIDIIENGESIKKALKLMNKNIKYVNIAGEIDEKFNIFLSNIFVKKTDINYLLNDVIDEYDNKKQQYVPDNILNIMRKLKNDETVLYATEYNFGIDINEAGAESIINLKKILLDNLIEQNNFDMEYYDDLDLSLSYKDLIKNNNIDNISFGKELINAIITNLYEFCLKIRQNGNILTKDGGNTNLFEEYSLFNFLKFEIIGEYIEITDITKQNRIISEELLPNLTYLKNQQYDRDINYEQLLSLLLSINKNNMADNNDLVKEILKVMSQEYIIAFQPKINVLIWNIVRLIVCWYADDKLRENIFKIRILINSFRSRGDQEYNIKNGIEPLITVYPEYGKKNAYLSLAYLSLYFFKFKSFGSKKNEPTFYKKIDGESLIYYTNSSTDAKKYIKYIKQNKQNKLGSEIFDEKMTIIDDPENNIEFTLTNRQNKMSSITEDTTLSKLLNEKEPTMHDIFE